MTNSYRYIGNIKGGIFLIGIFLTIGIFYYNNFLSRELRKDNRQVVKLYAEIIANAVNDDNDVNINFIFDNIIKKVKFPLVQSSKEKIPLLWKNLPPSIKTDEDRKIFLKSMDEINEPIPLIFHTEDSEYIVFGYLHYGDSSLMQKIKLWTYVEIVSIGVFICIGFLGFSFIRNSEKQNIWVGLCRETAHQLGTPVSALIGWLDYLKNENINLKNILPEIESDIDRLQQVSRRFSKMGSKPKIEAFNLSNRLNNTINYLKKRMPSLGGKVNLINNIDADVKINANGTLISWALENLIRNGIDSIKHDSGLIVVDLKQDYGAVKIQISDNGCGIPKRDWKNIFRPGFSTKNSGWGLGLSLCQRIINDVHGGEIYVSKSSINKGTIFEIILPNNI
jgi:hypothetical protein